MLIGFAWSYSSLLLIRFLFGAGEAGAWPNVARTFSRWFPRRDRGTVQGTFFMDERPLEKTDWRRLLANRTVICLCLMYFTQTFGNAFYVTWLPTYLASTGLSVSTAAILSGLPLTLSVVADLTGGITTDMAARRLGLRLGRVLVGGGALTAAGLFTIAAAFTDSPIAGAVLIALGGASSNFLLGAAWGTCLDIGGRRAGALSGAMNTSGQVGAILSPILIALVVQRSGIPAAPLFVTGMLFLLGAVAWLGVDPTKPVSD